MGLKCRDLLLLLLCAVAVDASPGALREQYFSFRDSSDYARAITVAARMVEASHASAEAWGYLGEAKCGQGQWYGAVVALRKALRLGSKQSADRGNLATALTQLGWERYRGGGPGPATAARRVWREACAVDPENPAPRVSLGDVALNEGDLGTAEREYLRSLQIDPGSAYAYTGLGRVYAAQDDAPRAIQCLRMAIRLAPSEADPHGSLAAVLLHTGDPTGAEESLRTAIRLSPGNAKYHGQLGTLLSDREAWPEAEAQMREAVRVIPGDPRCRRLLAQVLSVQGRHAEAEVEWQQVVTLSPKSAAGWEGLGRSQYLQAEYAEAEYSFRNAIDLSVGSPASVLYELGRTQLAHGKTEHAAVSLQKAVQASQDHSEYWRELAWSLFEMGDLAGAAPAAERAVELNSKDALAHGLLGAAYAALRQFEKAQSQLQEALRLSPTTPVIDAIAAACAAQMDQKDEATAYLKKAMEADSEQVEPWTWYFVGQAQRALGDGAAAARSFEAFLESRPDSPYRTELRDFIQTHLS